MALSGQGADELFGGYSKHQAAALVAEWRRLPPASVVPASACAPAPARVRRAAQRPRRTRSRRPPARMSGHLDAAARRGSSGERSPPDGGRRTAPRRARLDGLRTTRSPRPSTSTRQLGLVDDMLHYFDRTSMAHSLEVRVPFLDHKLVEFCATIPPG